MSWDEESTQDVVQLLGLGASNPSHILKMVLVFYMDVILLDSCKYGLLVLSFLQGWFSIL